MSVSLIDPIMYIDSIKKVFDGKFLHVFETEFTIKGNQHKWVHVSRHNEARKEISGPDSVGIVPFWRVDGAHGSTHCLVGTIQPRPSIKAHEFAFPAGLVDKNETIEEAAKRELKEETGLDTKRILSISPVLYNSAGMTDESVQIVFVEATGTISTKFQEESENIKCIHMTEMNIKSMFSYLKNNIKIAAKTYLIIQMIELLGFDHFLMEQR